MEISGVTLEQFLRFKKEKAEDITKKLKKIFAWENDKFDEYNRLLVNLKAVNSNSDSSAREKGKALETIVSFIFENSFFYEVYENRRTAINEIDEYIIRSDKGKQFIEEVNMASELLLSTQDYFLCECKNYNSRVGVTWVGKFNTLLKISGDCQLGILFSYKGLTGNENKWSDAHGLTKLIYYLSESEKKKYILDFNISDFESLKDRGINLFDIIKAKKNALKVSFNSHELYGKPDGLEEMKNIYKELNGI